MKYDIFYKRKDHKEEDYKMITMEFEDYMKWVKENNLHDSYIFREYHHLERPITDEMIFNVGDKVRVYLSPKEYLIGIIVEKTEKDTYWIKFSNDQELEYKSNVLYKELDDELFYE